VQLPGHPPLEEEEAARVEDEEPAEVEDDEEETVVADRQCPFASHEPPGHAVPRGASVSYSQAPWLHVPTFVRHAGAGPMHGPPHGTHVPVASHLPPGQSWPALSGV
jgi:hypothetical protein